MNNELEELLEDEDRRNMEAMRQLKLFDAHIQEKSPTGVAG